MSTVIARLLITALAFLLAAYIVPGIVVADFYTALILAFLWGVVTLTVKPVLFVVTLPLHFLTFGLFAFFLNGALLWFLGIFVGGFDVDGFVPAVAGALVISLVSWLGGKFVGAIK